MFIRLRNQMLLLNLIIISLVMTASFAVVYISMANDIKRDNTAKLQGALSRSLFPPGKPSANPEYNPRLRAGTGGLTIQSSFLSPMSSPSFVLYINSEGELLHVESVVELSEESYRKAAELVKTVQRETVAVLENRTWLYRPANTVEGIITMAGRLEGSFTLPMNPITLTQAAFLDITESQNALRSLLLTFIIVGIAMIGIIYLISWYFANRSIRPIALAWEQQQQFIADASHELKTPLAIINANIDALEYNLGESQETQAEWLGYIKIGTARMAKLTNSLLTLACMEGSGQWDNNSPVNFSETVQKAVTLFAAAAAERELQLSTEIAPEVVISGERELTEQLLAILLDNAIKYADRGSKITVSLTSEPRSCLLQVSNLGEGIPLKELTKVFDRFYRVDTARSSGEGFGLGLAIAKSIVTRLGGEIKAESVGGITTFSCGFKLG